MTWGQLAVIASSRRPALAAGTATVRRGRAAQPTANSVPLGDPSLGAVTRDEALRVPAVHRGVDLIASTIGSFPLRSFKDNVDVTGTFLAQPESRFPGSFTVAQTVRDLIFDGVAYWVVVQRDAQGFPAMVERVAPWEMTGPLDGYVIAGGRPVPATSVIVFLGPDSDWSASGGLIARGLLATAGRTIQTAKRLEEAAARFAWQDTPTGVITTDEGEELEDEEIDELLSAWEAARRTRATAYLPASVKWAAAGGPDPEKLQLNESRQYIAAEVARHLNLPPRYVGASSGDSMTYNSQAADRRDLVDLGFRPWITSIETVLSMPHVTARGTTVRLDPTEFTSSDPKERSEVIATYLDKGVTDVAEVRRWLNLPAKAPEAP